MLARALRWLGLALVLSLAVAYAVINFSGHAVERWHVDPATVADASDAPNEFLAARPGTTAAEPDMETQVHEETPNDLIARFDAIVRDQPRTEVVAGDVDSLMITYVQRSKYVGFPDYITVKAVPAEEGASLIVWSRSRYGRDDFGVNEARVKAWLSELNDDREGA